LAKAVLLNKSNQELILIVIQSTF